jgi:hypothetical protein
MAELRWNQSSFSAGQLDPKTFARDDIAPYFKGAKRITNCLVIPQGGVKTRWGTDYIDTLASTNAKNVQLTTFLYNDDSKYLLVWEAGVITIYLESVKVAILSTPYAGEDIANVYSTQVNNRVVATNGNFRPRQLIRAPNAASDITSVSAIDGTITIAATQVAGQVLPVQFIVNGTGSLPVTSPQIFAGNRTYFLRMVTNVSAKIYASASEAGKDINAFAIISAGVNAQAVIQNTWTFPAIDFIEQPSYDFPLGAYRGNVYVLTFEGSNRFRLNINGTGFFDSTFLGGAFVSLKPGPNGEPGGVMRMDRLSVSNPTTEIFGYGEVNFPGISDDPHTLDLQNDEVEFRRLAWTDALGWPRVCGFYQGRLIMAGSFTLPNGVWLSVINEVYNFNDVGIVQDDSAISYYTSSGAGIFIRSITSARTLLIHTNTGTYTSSTASDAPLTATNFFLTEQNKDGVSALQPVFIDNQVIYIDSAGRNAKSLVFDVIQGQYILSNISVISSICIQAPVDMDVLLEPSFTDGAYVMFVNGDGTMGIFQTLTSQNIAAWSTAYTRMGNLQTAYFRHVASIGNESWLITERTVQGQTKLFLERIDFEVRTDASKTFKNLNSDTITGLQYLAGQPVSIVADGFVITDEEISADGVLVLPDVYQTVVLGLPIDCELALLPIGSIPYTPANLYKPMHIRAVYVNFYETVAGRINGTVIVEPNVPGFTNQPRTPQDGVFMLKLMNGWDNIQNEIVITQSRPSPMTILGVGYILEIP